MSSSLIARSIQTPRSPQATGAFFLGPTPPSSDAPRPPAQRQLVVDVVDGDAMRPPREVGQPVPGGAHPAANRWGAVGQMLDLGDGAVEGERVPVEQVGGGDPAAASATTPSGAIETVATRTPVHRRTARAEDPSWTVERGLA